MILGIGIDLCDAQRIEKSLEKPSFCGLCVCTGRTGPAGGTFRQAPGRDRRGHFAAKEAFLKAAGTGLGGFALSELALLRAENGAPYFELQGRAAAWATQRGLTVHVSLTHERGLANAIVLLEEHRPKGE